MIRVQGLHKRFGSQPVLRGIDLDIATGEDSLGPYLQLKFELDSGCYATTALREITKSDL